MNIMTQLCFMIKTVSSLVNKVMSRCNNYVDPLYSYVKVRNLCLQDIKAPGGTFSCRASHKVQDSIVWSCRTFMMQQISLFDKRLPFTGIPMYQRQDEDRCVRTKPASTRNPYVPATGRRPLRYGRNLQQPGIPMYQQQDDDRCSTDETCRSLESLCTSAKTRLRESSQNPRNRK